MHSLDLVRVCAIAIRPYLSDLVGPESARVDRELEELLELTGSSRLRDRAILEALDRDARTRAWTARFLARGDDVPDTPDVPAEPAEREPTRGYSAVAGTSAVRAAIFVCPIDGFRWIRRDDDDPVPHCPIDPAHPPLAVVPL